MVSFYNNFHKDNSSEMLIFYVDHLNEENSPLIKQALLEDETVSDVEIDLTAQRIYVFDSRFGIREADLEKKIEFYEASVKFIDNTKAKS